MKVDALKGHSRSKLQCLKYHVDKLDLAYINGRQGRYAMWYRTISTLTHGQSQCGSGIALFCHMLYTDLEI